MHVGLPRRSTDGWLDELRRDGTSNAAVADLRAYLSRGLRKALAGRRVADADLDDFVQDALMRILTNLDGFRGEARFTTWAMAVAVRTASSALRRRRYRDRLEDTDPSAMQRAEERIADGTDPAADLDRQRMLAALRTAIDTELTERQRTAVLGELSGVPSEVLAERMGMTRNALYKLNHDARRKLRHAIVETGPRENDVRSGAREASEAYRCESRAGSRFDPAGDLTQDARSQAPRMMKTTDPELRELLRLVLATEADEIDCDEFLTRVAGFLEALGPAGKVPPELRAVSQHLDVCGECREEYDALLAAFRDEAD